MPTKRTSKPSVQQGEAQMVSGWILILVGVIFLFDKLGLYRVFGVGIGGFVGTFWPLILVGFGSFAIQQKDTRTGILLLTLGVIFQLAEIVSLSIWSMFWPLILIGIGALIVIREK